MTQDNPYMKLYTQIMNTHLKLHSKQHFYSMAVNLGQIHNVLGNVISDIIKLMGTLSFENLQNGKNSLTNQAVHKMQIKAQNNRILKNQKKPKSPPKQRAQKMQVENYQQQPQQMNQNDSNKAQREINLKKDAYEKEVKAQENKNEFYLKSFYQDLLFMTNNKEQSQKPSNRSSREDSPDSSSQKTQTAELVRSNENERKLAAKSSFDELNKYMMNQSKDEKPYKINLKKPNQKQRQVKKQKSPFFDLYDSSQSESIMKNDLFDNEEISNYKQIDIDKLYARTQKIDNSTKLNQNEQKGLYSPQMKKEKNAQNIDKNCDPKATNLLEVTRWNDSCQQNMFDVEEQIDEIESSQKKPLSRFTNNMRNGQKRQVQSETVEYVPRREQKGRKKSDRQQYQGSECPDCKAFYEAISDDSRSFKDMCQCTSRHKSSTTFMPKHKVVNFSQEFRLN